MHSSLPSMEQPWQVWREHAAAVFLANCVIADGLLSSISTPHDLLQLPPRGLFQVGQVIQWSHTLAHRPRGLRHFGGLPKQPTHLFPRVADVPEFVRIALRQSLGHHLCHLADARRADVADGRLQRGFTDVLDGSGTVSFSFALPFKQVQNG